MTKQSKWTTQEEDYLRFLKEEKQLKDWKTIAIEITTKFPSSKKRPKQCRERYLNYTKFGIEHGSSLDWERSQEMVIYENYIHLGPCWKVMSANLTKRSENCIKNKFYSGIRKFVRRFNSVPFQTYNVKFETIKRMLDATDTNNNSSDPCFTKYLSLRDTFLRISQLSDESLQKEVVEEIKQKFIQFNKEMRFLCLKKKCHNITLSTQQCRGKTKKKNGGHKKNRQKKQKDQGQNGQAEKQAPIQKPSQVKKQIKVEEGGIPNNHPTIIKRQDLPIQRQKEQCPPINQPVLFNYPENYLMPPYPYYPEYYFGYNPYFPPTF